MLFLRVGFVAFVESSTPPYLYAEIWVKDGSVRDLESEKKSDGSLLLSPAPG
jgi:hypothetical protein